MSHVCTRKGKRLSELSPISFCRYRSFVIWLAVALATAWSFAAASDLQAVRQGFHRYLRIAGESRQPVYWCLFSEDDRFRLVSRSEDETAITWSDESLETVRWELIDPVRDTRVSARRVGNRIEVNGRFKGKPVGDSISIDDRPWYQASSLSLSAFALSSDKRVRFWTLRPDTLKAHKVVAIKQDTDSIEVNGSARQALRIKVRLTGVLAPFWGSTYWFGLQDGIFLQFEGPGGPPGSPSVTIRYEGTQKVCSGLDKKRLPGRSQHLP